MPHHIAMLLVIAMVGLLCAAFWAGEPQVKVKDAQQVRVKHVSILSFH